MPFATISPDGTSFLVAIGFDLDQNGRPALSQLVKVELESRDIHVLAEYAGFPSAATWSADGRWVISLEDRSVRLYDTNQPANSPLTLTGVIPEGFTPLGAG
jgi:Tol biopolymer transport system component